MDNIIHYCCYSAHNSLQLVCDLSWTFPKWGTDKEKETGMEEVYLSDDDRLYTFNYDKVSCEDCLEEEPND